ncbi:hypothetical protein [Paraburkholderia oxyphila]|uniref:hypothetical protein n=1 Tax=Paraburkholderia oxyphila TaxID=614212 RepID=UPI0005B8AC1A|nr:hypothetical protein [Paraburkholderia oxyphila]
MKTKLPATLLIAVFTAYTVPVFASGYGPAPFYNPQVGAPASQRGQSALSLQADQHNVMNVAERGSSRPVSRTVVHTERLPVPGEQLGTGASTFD